MQWDNGRFDELVMLVAGQQAVALRWQQSMDPGPIGVSDDDERRGKRARRKAAGNAVRKAMQGLVGGVATRQPSASNGRLGISQGALSRRALAPGPLSQRLLLLVPGEEAMFDRPDERCVEPTGDPMSHKVSLGFGWLPCRCLAPLGTVRSTWTA